MQAPYYPWSTPLALSGRPTVGTLMSLCEENYQTLQRMIPDLRQARGEMRSGRALGLDLHLEILEQAPYTTLLRLTYFFPHDDGLVHRIPEADPDALLRAYHDARQTEVIDLRQTALPVRGHYRSTALEAKWRANLFLAKWLGYCIRQGHRFHPATAHTDRGEQALAPPCPRAACGSPNLCVACPCVGFSREEPGRNCADQPIELGKSGPWRNNGAEKSWKNP